MEETMAVTIDYAGYGVWESTREATSEIRKAYKSGQRKFLATNDWVGDPKVGERKYLYIVWSEDGVKSSGVVGEDDARGVDVP
jgi:hypothetical protein